MPGAGLEQKFLRLGQVFLLAGHETAEGRRNLDTRDPAPDVLHVPPAVGLVGVPLRWIRIAVGQRLGGKRQGQVSPIQIGPDPGKGPGAVSRGAIGAKIIGPSGEDPSPWPLGRDDRRRVGSGRQGHRGEPARGVSWGRGKGGGSWISWARHKGGKHSGFRRRARGSFGPGRGPPEGKTCRRF